MFGGQGEGVWSGQGQLLADDFAVFHAEDRYCLTLAVLSGVNSALLLTDFVVDCRGGAQDVHILEEDAELAFLMVL